MTDAAHVFKKELSELAFLSVVLGTNVHVPRQGRVWTWIITDKAGNVECSVRNLGYYERETKREMPNRGMVHCTPLASVERPDFSKGGIDVSLTEQSVPADIIELWTAYQELTADQKQQFLQAAAKWQEALTHWRERRTLSFALMVVACEALKPAGSEFRRHNIYQVIGGLLGAVHVERLRKYWPHPQDVRNAHLHRGEFRSSEFVLEALSSDFYDPAFDEACSTLASITQAVIVEWLKRHGTFNLPIIRAVKTRKTRKTL